MDRTWLERTIRRGRGTDHFPHQLWFIMDNPVRRLLVNPRQLVDRLELTGSEQVLEVGPGPGLFSAEIAGRLPAGRLELFDLQPEMLAKARCKLDRAGHGNVGFHAGDASQGLPFPDASFDVAFLAAVLGEVADKRACARSLFRVLRPGGLLAVQDFFLTPTACACRRSAPWRNPKDSGSWTRRDAHGSTPSASGAGRQYLKRPSRPGRRPCEHSCTAGTEEEGKRPCPLGGSSPDLACLCRRLGQLHPEPPVGVTQE